MNHLPNYQPPQLHNVNQQTVDDHSRSQILQEQGKFLPLQPSYYPAQYHSAISTPINDPNFMRASQFDQGYIAYQAIAYDPRAQQLNLGHSISPSLQRQPSEQAQKDLSISQSQPQIEQRGLQTAPQFYHPYHINSSQQQPKTSLTKPEQRLAPSNIQSSQNDLKKENSVTKPHELHKQKNVEESNASKSKLKEDKIKQNSPKLKNESISKSKKFYTPKWRKEDDQILQRLATLTNGKWKEIALQMNKLGITPLYLKNKYYELNPTKKGMFKKYKKYSHKEDLMITKYSHVYNNDWAKVSLHFLNRDGHMLKNRFYTHIKRNGYESQFIEEAYELEEKFKCLIDELDYEENGTLKGPADQINDCEEDAAENLLQDADNIVDEADDKEGEGGNYNEYEDEDEEIIQVNVKQQESQFNGNSVEKQNQDDSKFEQVQISEPTVENNASQQKFDKEDEDQFIRREEFLDIKKALKGEMSLLTDAVKQVAGQVNEIMNIIAANKHTNENKQ